MAIADGLESRLTVWETVLVLVSMMSSGGGLVAVPVRGITLFLPSGVAAIWLLGLPNPTSEPGMLEAAKVVKSTTAARSDTGTAVLTFTQLMYAKLPATTTEPWIMSFGLLGSSPTNPLMDTRLRIAKFDVSMMSTSSAFAFGTTSFVPSAFKARLRKARTPRMRAISALIVRSITET